MLARCLLSGEGAEEVRIFYSYSRKDADFRQLIDGVLGSFKWDVNVRTWYDGEIPAGNEWEKDIFRNIDAADIILLFVTEHFVSSSYCRDVEVPRALSRQRKDQATVIPVLVESVSTDSLDPSLKALQFLPRNGVPVDQWADRDAAIRSVIQGIVDIIASANLDPEGRCRWRLRLRSDERELDEALQLEVVQDLRNRADDPSLRPLALGAGSVVLTVESSRAGLTNFKSWHAEESAPKVAGMELLEVIELFGAGVQASMTESKEVLPASRNDTDLLLFPSEPFVPAFPKGVVINDDDPLTPSFILDTGDSDLEGEAFHAESLRLIEFFLTAVALPEDQLWVNLSPDESNRMLGKGLAGTEMGRRLLEIDLQLKRLSASLMHPDCETGRAFWDEVHLRARGRRGLRSGEFATFQRVWLVPQKAVVYAPDKEAGKTKAFVVENRIQVLCKDDYVSQYASHGASIAPDTNDVCTPVFKEIVLPVIEKEVNEGKNFAPFRQIYYCMILAAWLKNEFGEHPQWSRFIDSGNPSQLAHTLNKIGPADINRLIKRHDAESADGEGPSGDSPGASAEKAAPEETAVNAAAAAEVAAEAARVAMRERAVALREAGDHAGSRRRLQELVDFYACDRGTSAQQTQEVMSQLGRTLREMGLLQEARDQHAEVLRVRRYVLGDNHPYTINSMGILADTLDAMGEEEAASGLRAEMAARKARTSEAFSIRENREFYEQYMQVFRGGVFRLRRDEYIHDQQTSERVCRTYFSGAVDFRSVPLEVRGTCAASATELRDHNP